MRRLTTHPVRNSLNSRNTRVQRRRHGRLSASHRRRRRRIARQQVRACVRWGFNRLFFVWGGVSRDNSCLRILFALCMRALGIRSLVLLLFFSGNCWLYCQLFRWRRAYLAFFSLYIIYSIGVFSHSDVNDIAMKQSQNGNSICQFFRKLISKWFTVAALRTTTRTVAAASFAIYAESTNELRAHKVLRRYRNMNTCFVN